MKIFLAVIIVGILAIFASSYNSLVVNEEIVSESWADVESNMQRKVDLLPNLVKVVKLYAEHESKLFTSITELRASSKSVLGGSEMPSKEQMQEFSKLNKSINSSTLKLFAVAENYPNLKSSEQFLTLQAQIEGTENRINVTRMNFNGAVKDFNANIRTFPSNIVASIMSFSKLEYFKAEPVAKQKLELDL